MVEAFETLESVVLGSSETDEKQAKQADKAKEIEDEFIRRIAERLNQRHEKGFFQRVLYPLILLVATLAGLVVCAILCIPCLFGILVFSAITCGCQPVMNVPLWGSIVVLLVRGWTFTNGHMTLIWS